MRTYRLLQRCAKLISFYLNWLFCGKWQTGRCKYDQFEIPYTKRLCIFNTWSLQGWRDFWEWRVFSWHEFGKKSKSNDFFIFCSKFKVRSLRFTSTKQCQWSWVQFATRLPECISGNFCACISSGWKPLWMEQRSGGDNNASFAAKSGIISSCAAFFVDLVANVFGKPLSELLKTRSIHAPFMLHSLWVNHGPLLLTATHSNM